MIEGDGFRLVNDPGYWGAADPLILVLGQTKGLNQWRALRSAEFDAVAFARMRHRLLAVLSRIDAMDASKPIDTRFTADESDFGFASLLRCSLSTLDGKSSGSPIVPAMGTPSGTNWVRNCFDRWLTTPNPRLRLVVFLGLSDRYVKAVLGLLKARNPATFHALSDTVASTGRLTWLFAQHPSGVAENHYQRWIGDDQSSKRDAAIRGVRIALGNVGDGHGSDSQAHAALKDAEGASATEGAGKAPSIAEDPVRRHRTSAPLKDGVRVQALKKAISELLFSDPAVSRGDCLASDNKKMLDWRTSSGAVFAHEHGNLSVDHIWAHDTNATRVLENDIQTKPYPAGALWTSRSADGTPNYGRHSALRSIPELENASLLRFTPRTTDDLKRILDAIKIRGG